MSSRFVYGPVPSRRLGRSLGVDLVPFKTCTYDCLYCQLGRTTDKTTDRRQYVPVDGVLDELAGILQTGADPDYIGLAGSGEPTLHAGIGEIIAGIKKLTTVPVAVLTNGSLLWQPEVRAALAQADLVMPSLDAGSAAVFEKVNRPHRDITFELMVAGLREFTRGFRGEVWLEVFILGGLTDHVEELKRIVALADRIRPARVQLNTVARPPAESQARATPHADLARLCGFFTRPCEVIAENRPASPPSEHGGDDGEAQIVALLSRRPCTVDGIATGLALRPNEVLKHLDALVARGEVLTERRGDAVFYAKRHRS